MLKGLLTFGLTRRPLILLGLLVFITTGLFAFTRLNIEAYPNPAPVILEITAQSPGLSAEEMERYYTIPMEVGLAATPGVDNIRSTSFYGLVFRPRHLQIRRRLLFRADPGRAQPAAERQPAEQCSAADPGLEPGRRNVSLSGGRPAEFRPDQSSHRRRTGSCSADCSPSRAWCRSIPGAGPPRNSRSRSISINSTPTTSRCRK